MDYYLCKAKTRDSRYWLLWKIDGKTATRVGIPDPKNSKNCYCEVASEKDILAAIAQTLDKSEIVGTPEFYKIIVSPGQYFPRIARPNNQHPEDLPGFYPGHELQRNFIAISLGQLNVLVRQLDNICSVVHPSEATFNTYGHSIRNLLILACTEVETHWRGVLADNGIMKERYNTKDYVMLNDAMRLKDYSINFPNFPWIKSIRPFGEWDAAKPTSSLSWYDAYNAVKHNREGEFERATLRHVFEAIAACAVMMISQFSFTLNGWRTSESNRFFNFDSVAAWDPSEIYIFPYDEYWINGFTEVWTPINYPFKPQ